MKRTIILLSTVILLFIGYYILNNKDEKDIQNPLKTQTKPSKKEIPKDINLSDFLTEYKQGEINLDIEAKLT
ncbi:MAG: hypothetical protein N4A45_05665 [Flavobacteriales bacterium]|jgi:uncharacterized protein YxeA|nr:hypothetical protein [Flavobacteriales bacterium]